MIEASSDYVCVSNSFLVLWVLTCWLMLLCAFVCSREEPADLQHWDEEQDEGPSDGWRCHLLEVDQPQHHRSSHRDVCLPLVHGGWVIGDSYLGSRCVWFIDLVWHGIGAYVIWNGTSCNKRWGLTWHGMRVVLQATPFAERGRVWSRCNYWVVAEERNYQT